MIMNTRATATLITLLTTTQAAGCYATWDIDPHSLRQLDGLRKGTDRSLLTYNSDPVTISSSTKLDIRMRDGSKVDGLQLQSADVDGGYLIAVEDGYGRVQRYRIEIDNVAAVQASDTDYASTGKRVAKGVGISLGVVLGTGVLIGGTILALSFVAVTNGGGRPLHVAGQDSPVRANVWLDPMRRRSVRHQRTDTVTEAYLLQHWVHEASSECASIPAFLALARDLKWAGAPTGLVEQALRAAREEAVHTELCIALANAYAPASLQVQTPNTPHHTDINPKALLKRLALEAFWDGCLAEGIAASVARRSISLAKDHETRNALRTISQDEQNHADLSRQILAYCVSIGGPSIRNALVENLEEKRAEEEARIEHDGQRDEPAFDEDLAREYGLAGRDTHRNARAEIWEKNIAMVARM